MKHLNTRWVFVILLGLFLADSAYCQNIVAIETKWSDSFKEWTIYTEGDSIEGNLALLWALDNDWTEWTFELGDLTGKIKQRYNDPGFWEFRSGNEIITTKTMWSGDLSEWRFTDGSTIIKLKSKYYDIPWMWYSVGEQYGYIDIYREFEDDPTFWIIEDYLNEEISPLYRLALIFVAIYHSTPKF